jgi:methylated-DNA-[protein]-cysteine S-methyltransferase
MAAMNSIFFPLDTQFNTTLICSVAWNEHGCLTSIEFSSDDSSQTVGSTSFWAPPAIQDLIERLKKYFRTGAPLGTLPWEWIDQRNWTPFQYQVYSAIAKIPHGETRTYSWVASRIGKKTATRAVGQALKKNPLPVFVPCHRVVAADSLGGFMGTSDPNQPQMALKKQLLNTELNYLNPCFDFMLGAHAG